MSLGELIMRSSHGGRMSLVGTMRTHSLMTTIDITPLGLCLGAFLLPSIQIAYKRPYNSDSVLSATAVAYNPKPSPTALTKALWQCGIIVCSQAFSY